MDEQNKPMARKKKIVGEAQSVEKKGEGLGTGPVGQSSQQPPKENFTQPSAPKPVQQSTQRPVQSSYAQAPKQPEQRPYSAGQQNAQRPVSGSYSQAQQSSQRPGQGFFGQAAQSAQRPQQSSAQRPPHTSAQRPQGTQQASQSYQSQRPQGTQRPAASSGTSQQQRSSGTSAGGGGSKLIILLIAAVAIFFLGKNFLGGGNSGDGSSQNTGTDLISTLTQTGSDNTGTGGGGIINLLSSFMGSSESSAYDFSGILSGLSGSGSTGSSDQYFTTSMDNNTQQVDTTVSAKARDKFTRILGKNKDTITILVYMCGTDLESQNGMGTADLKEMLNASLSDKVNLIVYTGGCKKWRNNVVSSSKNQIYQIKNGSLTRLVEDAGTASMTNPNTLAEFIKFGAENFEANRMCLIFWDHGGGSVSGYGYDERYGSGQSMTLAGINEALQKGGVQFDFIGFDACLMATVENGLMLSQYADYMIASEETEPGVGWYYTNWLNKVSSNTSMSTVDIGKIITDDFVEVCNKQCRGQATTLSVVDLAELAATVPEELKTFSIDTNELIQNKEYKKVSSARSKTREFASSTKIDQIDLVHFAKNMNTKEGTELADALLGAVKYNRTGGGISNAYGLSIYFPYKKTGKVNQMVSTYKAIGMDDEYTRCIQEFASLEVSGQISAGTSTQSYGSSNSGAMPGLLESLMGSSGSYYGNVSSNYSSGGLESILGGLYGGSSGNSGSTGSILDLFIGRVMTSDKAAEYIYENHFDPSVLEWNNGRISISAEQWDFIEDVNKKVYIDDGEGYIDLGFEPLFEEDYDGNDLVYYFDNSWLSIDLQPVVYYRTAYVEQDDCCAEMGYLIIVFDSDHEYGYIAGAEIVYQNGETEASAKNLIAIGEGTRLEFICDYYDYEGNYKDSYIFGKPVVLGKEVVIGNATFPEGTKTRVTYCLTDYYQQNYWTPAVE